MYRSIETQQHWLEKMVERKRIPLSFSLEITARCNNNCRHCYINLPAEDPRARSAELTLEEIADIAEQAVEMGALTCLLTGGEPLLRPDFPDIYLGLKRKGLLVSVFTNATLIGEQHVELWKRYPPRDLEVTVYGVTRATYEAVTRRPGAFDAFQRGLRLLLDNGISVRLKTMALRSNLGELHHIADFCRRYTEGLYRFDPLLHLRYDGNPRRNAEILDERLRPEEIVALERADPERLSALNEHCHHLIREESRDSGCAHLFRCGAGVGSFAISYDGVFRLCDSLWAHGTTFDLRRGTLSEAWLDFVPWVRNLPSQNLQSRQTCGGCPLINLCLSCPAHAHLETGEMEGTTPYFCAVARARAAMLRETSHVSRWQRVPRPVT